MKQCQHCHMENPNDAVFCEHCGSKIEEVPKQQPCPHCHGENEAGALFCEHCGFNLKAQEEIIEVNKINCPNCFSPNDPEALFCEECGFNLKSEIKEDQLTEETIIEEDMLNCPNCSTPNSVDALFCETCGFGLQTDTTEVEVIEEAILEDQDDHITDIKTVSEVVTPEVDSSNKTNSEHDIPQEVTPLPVKPAKKKMAKNKKIGIGIAAAVVVIIGGGFAFMNEYMKPLKQLDRIVNAIEDDDASYLVKHMTSSNGKLSFTEGSIQPMIEYFTTNPEALDNLATELSYNGVYEGFYLSENGKTALFFPRYDLTVEAIDAAIETNTSDTTIYLDDEKIAKTDSEDILIEISNLIPGTYHLKAVYNPEKGEEKTTELTYNLVQSEEPIINLGFHTVEFPIESNMEDADILLNGEKAGRITDGRGTLGPMMVTSDMKVKLKNKGIETEEVTLTDYLINDDDTVGDIIYLDSDAPEEEEIRQGIDLFYDEFAKVVQSDYKYSPDKFANEFFVDGQKNNSFSGINDYIKWCRDRSAKNEYGGVEFSTYVSRVEPTKGNEYKINYRVIYSTSYPASTKKDVRVEEFTYKDAVVQFEKDDSGKVTHFKFVNMGNGGVKTSDNKANE